MPMHLKGFINFDFDLFFSFILNFTLAIYYFIIKIFWSMNRLVNVRTL